MSLVTIIIPAKDRLELLKETLESVLSQELPKGFSLEIIVIDDDSNPPIKDVMLDKKFSKIRIIRNVSRRHGPGAARNLGLNRARGMYVCFLDSDDLWKKNFIGQSLEAIKKRDGQASLSLVQPFFEKRYPLKEMIKSFILNEIRNLSLLIACYQRKFLPAGAFYLCHISAMMFETKIVKKFVFNEEAIAAEEWGFAADFIKDNKITIIPQRLSFFRYARASNTNKDMVNRGKWHAYSELIGRLSDEQKSGLFFSLFILYIKLFRK